MQIDLDVVPSGIEELSDLILVEHVFGDLAPCVEGRRLVVEKSAAEIDDLIDRNAVEIDQTTNDAVGVVESAAQSANARVLDRGAQCRIGSSARLLDQTHRRLIVDFQLFVIDVQRLGERRTRLRCEGLEQRDQPLDRRTKFERGIGFVGEHLSLTRANVIDIAHVGRVRLFDDERRGKEVEQVIGIDVFEGRIAIEQVVEIARRAEISNMRRHDRIVEREGGQRRQPSEPLDVPRGEIKIDDRRKFVVHGESLELEQSASSTAAHEEHDGILNQAPQKFLVDDLNLIDGNIFDGKRVLNDDRIFVDGARLNDRGSGIVINGARLFDRGSGIVLNGDRLVDGGSGIVVSMIEQTCR